MKFIAAFMSMVVVAQDEQVVDPNAPVDPNAWRADYCPDGEGVDSAGDGCDNYYGIEGEALCGQFDTADFVAAEQCCGCYWRDLCGDAVIAEANLGDDTIPQQQQDR